AVTVDFLTLRAVHSVLHPVGIVGQALVLDGERDLSSGAFAMVGRCGILHALVFLRAVPALQQTAFEVHADFAILSFACALVADGVARRADARQVDWIELELTGRNDVFPAGGLLVLVTLAVLVFLVLVLRGATAEFVVRHVAVDLPFVQVLHVGFVGEAGISGNDGTLLINVVCDAQLLEAGFHALQYRLQGVVFLAFANGLGVDDDLVLFIHRSHAVIALNRSLAGGHLGAFVIGDVALHFLVPFPPAHPWAVRL